MHARNSHIHERGHSVLQKSREFDLVCVCVCVWRVCLTISNEKKNRTSSSPFATHAWVYLGHFGSPLWQPRLRILLSRAQWPQTTELWPLAQAHDRPCTHVNMKYVGYLTPTRYARAIPHHTHINLKYVGISRSEKHTKVKRTFER